MKVRFKQDYRGVLSGERFFEEGEVADLSRGRDLVEAGRAEPIEEKPKPKAKKSSSRSRKKKKDDEDDS